jgi:uncharacterized protein (DUF983 family)
MSGRHGRLDNGAVPARLFLYLMAVELAAIGVFFWVLFGTQAPFWVKVTVTLVTTLAVPSAAVWALVTMSRPQ